MSMSHHTHERNTVTVSRGTRRMETLGALVVEARIGTATRWFDAGPGGCTERLIAANERPDLVLIGDDVAIQAVLGGHLSPHDAEREGQLEAIGPRTHLTALQMFLSHRRDARAA